MTFRETETRELEVTPKSSRLSFHPSEEVHLLGDEIATSLVPLAQLKQPLQLCILQFAHPSTYKIAASPAPTDVDLESFHYQIDEGCPMFGHVYVTPWTRDAIWDLHPNMVKWAGVGVGLSGFTKTPDLFIGVIVGHGPAADWPRVPGVIVATKAA